MHALSSGRRLFQAALLQRISIRLCSGQAGEDASTSAAVGAEGATAYTHEQVSEIVAQSFKHAPKETAAAILKRINELDRANLVLALAATARPPGERSMDSDYMNDLIKGSSKGSSKPYKGLTSAELVHALEYERMLHRVSNHSLKPPKLSTLGTIALASGVPFIAFGAIDNGVMLIAGDQIELAFGLKMGFSTLTCAALGNLVADVFGVAATHQIQARLKNARWSQPPPLSILQQNMSRTKVFKFAGATIGVTIGCIIGMLPLLFLNPDGERRSVAKDVSTAVEAV